MSPLNSETPTLPSGAGNDGQPHAKQDAMEVKARQQDVNGTASHSLWVDVNAHQEVKRVVVLGSGDFGLALTGRLVQANYQVVVGSRNPQKTRPRASGIGATVMQHEEALQQGEVVVMAVPFTHVASLPLQQLAGKIVIDVSNRTPATSSSLGSLSQAEELQALVPAARVVKAFNVLSAYALTRGNMGSKEVPVCSDDEAARRRVCEIARDLRFTPLDMGRLSNAQEVEAIPLSFFTEWRGGFFTSLAVFVFYFLLLLFEWQLCSHLQHPSNDWSSLNRLVSSNVSIACADTALTLLALCYLPGVLAAYLQLWRGTKYSQFPGWLDLWLKSRKHLGLLMLLNSLLHVILKLAGSPLSWNADWRRNAFVASGVFALVLAGILGLTSLPSVAGNMTWREFSFVQSVLGWFTLVLATLHLVFSGWDMLFKPDFTCYLPSNGQFVMVLPLLTLALKLPLLLPCVDSMLQNIRQGYDRTPSRTSNN
nr:STEAP-4-like protein [Scylla paramamosain]